MPWWPSKPQPHRALVDKPETETQFFPYENLCWAKYQCLNFSSSLLHYHSLALNIINKTLRLIQTFFSTSGMTESALWGALESLGSLEGPSHVGGQKHMLSNCLQIQSIKSRWSDVLTWGWNRMRYCRDSNGTNTAGHEMAQGDVFILSCWRSDSFGVKGLLAEHRHSFCGYSFYYLTFQNGIYIIRNCYCTLKTIYGIASRK